mgnify:CR=1 FL=1
MRRLSPGLALTTLLLGAVLPFPATARAQGAEGPVPEAPAAAAQEKEPDRWRFAVDFGFNGQIGNTQLIALSSGFQLKRLETEHFELELSAGYRYGRSRSEIVARSAQIRVALNMFPQARLSPYLFSTAERDRFRRLDLRSNGGGGMKYRVWDSQHGRMALIAAALYSYEDFTPTATATPNGARQNARWNVRLEAERRLGEAVKITHASAWQPVWDRASDFDIELTTTVATRVSQSVSMTMNHVYQHDSLPPEGVKREDQRLVVGLRLDL